MEAIREITDWGIPEAKNHTYLIDGSSLIAMIRNGENTPRFFKNPIRGFSKSGRKFVRLDIGLFGQVPKTNKIEVSGSNGSKYNVDKESKTCTCPGFVFRRACKHVVAL